MARPKVNTVLDMDNAAIKRRLMSWIGTLTGPYEVGIEPRRNTRSLRQNAYYFGCICQPLAKFLSAQDVEVTTTAMAHRVLKDRFLKIDVFDTRTGELIGQQPRRTRDLTTEEMGEYIERCRAWLADFFNIVVPDPEPDPAERQKQRREAAHA